ncbi:MAG: hypothetical protein ACJAYF_002368, partial [Arenicella sp.]
GLIETLLNGVFQLMPLHIKTKQQSQLIRAS